MNQNYSDERIRRYILQHAIVLGVVGLGGNMFKPFTNTKTIVLFLQKRYKEFTSIEEVHLADKEKHIAYCVTEMSGKDKTGKIITDAEGVVLSDLPEITEYLLKNIRFRSEKELKDEYEKIKAIKAEN